MNRNFKPIFNENGGIVNTEELKKNMIQRLTEKGFKSDLTNPKTIQDKLNWLSIYDVNSIKTLCADKLKIREYCKSKLGKDICVPLIATYEKTKDIDWKSLPDSFVIKCNHGSGMNVIVKNKNSIDKNSCIQKLDKWLNTDFSMVNNYELQYFNIPRRIVVEKLLADEKQTNSLVDYKFWCFNGEPKMYTLNTGHGHGDIMYFTMEDEPLNFYNVAWNGNIKKPSHFKDMVEYTKKLCSDFKFVRVDFYEVNGIVYLGELTFTPGANIFKYKKPGSDLLVGNMLKIK